MRSRKEHRISATAGDAQPARLVALAVDASVDAPPGEPTDQRESLVRWSGCGWARTAGGEYRHWRCASADKDRLWRALIWGAKRGGVTWIVSHRAVRVASLLGLWGMIDHGTIQWDGAGPAAGAGRRGTGGMRQVRQPSGNDDPVPRRDGVGGVSEVRRSGADAGHSGRDDPHGKTSAVGAVVIDDPPTILRLRVPGRPGRLWLLDSRNWGVEPEREHASAADEAEWLAGVMRRMVDALAERGWGGLKATAGSQSLAVWRRAYMSHNVVAHDDDEVLGMEEAAYVGGRCECFRVGRVSGPLYLVDRRSAYGHACANVDVPLAVKGRLDGQWDVLQRDPLRGGRCVAEARVNCTEPACAQAAEHGLRYPVGRWSAVLAGPELRDGIERGHVVGIGRCVEYECGSALRGYANGLWGARQAFQSSGDKELEAWVKRLIVSLPGKLGQRCASWEDAPRVPAPALWCAWWGVDLERTTHRLRALSGAVQKQQRAGWTYDSAPAIACWITSAARVELLRAIRVAQWVHVLYCDTDSLLLDQAGWERLASAPGLVGDGLGQWRLQRCVQEADIRGVKHYVLDGDVTCAGMPHTDAQATRLRDLYWYRTTFGAALHSWHAPQAGRRLQRFARAPRYALGRIGDGGVVYPFTVNEWEE